MEENKQQPDTDAPESGSEPDAGTPRAGRRDGLREENVNPLAPPIDVTAGS